MDMHPVLLEVFKNRFASIAEEMGVTCTRTAYSPNIKERRDLSCALFDASGEMFAQAAHIPVHLGSMPLSVKSAVRTLDLGPGDMAMLNDPFAGGTHLPDITLVAPVFPPQGGKAAFYVANRAHHADVGGMSPGSMPLSTSLYQEGLVIPPVKIVKAGKRDPDLMRLVLANVRTPAEREGDFAAQIMANLTGAARLGELVEKYGLDTVAAYGAGLMDHAERMARAALAGLPDGTWTFEDVLDDDGFGNRDIRLALKLTISGREAELDFRESADQTEGGLNAVRAIVLSAALYVLRCLAPDTAPANAGLLRPVAVLTRPGSVLDALPPAGVAGGNVETSQRVVDVILGALARAAPDRIPAASQGTMNNLAVGGVDPRSGKPFAYYETLGGGMGAGPGGPGESAVHSHMTNTMNTPVEALEYSYPFRVTAYGLRSGSGGTGEHQGGEGLVREMEFLAPCEANVLGERRVRGPWGLAGGGPGSPGANVLVRERREETMPGKFRAKMKTGETIRISTPGGGGWGIDGE